MGECHRRYGEEEELARVVCVTGATGYIGSWLVRSLLRRGYTVHATARDRGKANQLLSLWSSGDDDDRRLKIFRADLNEEGSFDEAVSGCAGVFHVAASMEFDLQSGGTDTENRVRTEILEPAVRGTINLLQSCLRSGTVKRVVFTSSISTITSKEDDGIRWKAVVDESSVTPMEQVWKTKPSGWVYVLSKLLTEEAAFKFSSKNGIDLVSIIPTTVAGPFLTPHVPASVQVLLSPVAGDPRFYSILQAVNERLGSVSVAHIDDICDAHIYLMEHQGAYGRYICSGGSCSISQLKDLLSTNHLSLNPDKVEDGLQATVPSIISSKRLLDLGFEFKHGIADVITGSLTCLKQTGDLSEIP